jgi:hypothetical protein
MADKINPQRLLTDFLRNVGCEETELVTVDGVPVMVSKAEALARRLYLMALGGSVEQKNDKGEIVTVTFEPSIPAAKLIREWTEGKPSENKTVAGTKGKRPERFDKNTGNRLSRVLKSDVATNNKTVVANTVPTGTGLDNGRKDRPAVPKKTGT